MKIEVITDDAFSRLEQLAAGAIRIRVAMAYWTIPATDLPVRLLQAMKDDAAGFLCCDIHNPTSIDALTSLKSSGVDVRLHLVSTSGKSEVADSTGMPNHLMHSKVIVFDYSSQDAVVWVGSHNGTFRALDGINFECTLAVHTDQSSSMYLEAQSHLDEIYAACKPFDLELIEHYRYLQGSKLENAVSVMEFENGNDQTLSLGEEITVFNMPKEDAKACRTVDAGVYVSLHGREEILYSARVVQTGETPAERDQSFSSRRYADRNKKGLPVLLGATNVTKEMYRKGTYFAMVKIEEKLDASHHLLEMPTESAWVSMPRNDSSRFALLDLDAIVSHKMSERGAKGLKFKVPCFQELVTVSECQRVDSPMPLQISMAFKEVDLMEKRQIKRPSLIRKKLLVRR
jgi:hypothetical protein